MEITLGLRVHRWRGFDCVSQGGVTYLNLGFLSLTIATGRVAGAIWRAALAQGVAL